VKAQKKDQSHYQHEHALSPDDQVQRLWARLRYC
jgi:hypothetical protein